jgi:hypothetical protein
VAVAALLLVTSLSAGRAYLWCSMMERAVDACCCEPASDGDEHDGPQLHPACCEDHALGKLATASPGAPALEIPAALAASLAPPAPMPRAAVAVPFAPQAATALCAAPIRAGPPRAQDTCVRLQVFRC